MGFLQGGTSRFFRNVGGSFRKFGSGLTKGLATTARFVEDKALPVIEKVAGGVATAAKYATPLLLASGVGAEFAPLAAAVGAGASAVQRGASTARSVINTANKIESGIRTGNAQKIISGVEEGAQTVMKISKPPTPNVLRRM
jgi:pyridoxal biosynthesis lyase PdxS